MFHLLSSLEQDSVKNCSSLLLILIHFLNFHNYLFKDKSLSVSSLHYKALTSNLFPIDNLWDLCLFIHYYKFTYTLDLQYGVVNLTGKYVTFGPGNHNYLI